MADATSPVLLRDCMVEGVIDDELLVRFGEIVVQVPPEMVEIVSE